MVVRRVDVGVRGLENLIQGGLPEGSPILVSGSPGTGKTLFGLQFLYHGVKNGEPGVYVTFEEPRESIVTASENFGWNLADAVKERKFAVMEYFELGNEVYINEMEKVRAHLRDLEAKRAEITLRDRAEEIEVSMADYQSRLKQIEELVTERRYTLTQHEREQEFIERLFAIVSSMRAKRLVIDSLSAYAIYDESRESIHRFIRKIRDLGTTTLLISELPKNSSELSRDGVSEFVCDGIILFSLERTKDATFRKIRVEKMRHTKIDGAERFLWFTDAGLEVKDRPQDI